MALTCEKLNEIFETAKAQASEIAAASRTVRVGDRDVPLSDFDPVYVKDETLVPDHASTIENLQTILATTQQANKTLRALMRSAYRERDMMAQRLTEVIRERDEARLALRQYEPEPEAVVDPLAAAIAAHQNQGQR